MRVTARRLQPRHHMKVYLDGKDVSSRCTVADLPGTSGVLAPGWVRLAIPDGPEFYKLTPDMEDFQYEVCYGLVMWVRR